MASTPFISHAVNGYSRYEIPESVAFSATPGILYPVRCDFLNARDVRYIQSGAVIRTEPAFVPTFTPFRVSLHRFFVPMQLYHPEMRVNSSNFDFQTLSTNCIPTGNISVSSSGDAQYALGESQLYSDGRSLLSFLGLWTGKRMIQSFGSGVSDYGKMPFNATDAASTVPSWGSLYVNADAVLAYYDIIRSYYSFSQVGTISLAFPVPGAEVAASLALPTPGTIQDLTSPTEYGDAGGSNIVVGGEGQYWRQFIGELQPFDDLFETAFYPRRGSARGLYYDRSADICEAVYSSAYAAAPSHSPQQIQNVWSNLYLKLNTPVTGSSALMPFLFPIKTFFMSYLPFGVAPAVADRFSRLLPLADNPDVSISNIDTVRGLAFASKLQAYKDLLSSGGSRFSDWLMTFFAAKVKHVDRPVLVYSSSFYMNSSPIFSQAGDASLGRYAGVIQGESAFGKKTQRYSFDEPGYLIDIFCIRPLYYWSGIQKDFARYDKLDYFNPIFNQIGYETIPQYALGAASGSGTAVAKQPCYNEFRASYDRVLGDLALVPGRQYSTMPVLSSWVQQRRAFYDESVGSNTDTFASYFQSLYFTDVNQANSVFASTSQDNFYVNLYYNVTSKSLVSKNFATNLASR